LERRVQDHLTRLAREGKSLPHLEKYITEAMSNPKRDDHFEARAAPQKSPLSTACKDYVRR